MKLSLFARIFLTFSIFSILILNSVLYFSYYMVEKVFISNIKSSIYSQLSTIKTFININNSDIFSLPLWEVKQFNKLWLFFNIQLSNKPIQTKFIKQNNKLFLQTYYHGYIIIIWKDLKDLFYMRNTFMNVAIYLNLITIFLILSFSYFLTKFSLNPLYKLISFLKNYKLWCNKKTLKNNYWNKDIWALINSVNKFILSANDVYNTQKEFIQDTSHELKTPLMQINTNLDILETKIKEQNIISKLESIRQSTDYLNNLVSNLNFILQDYKHTYIKESIDLCDYLMWLKWKFEDLISKKRITFNIHCYHHLHILSNKYFLDRLFKNLITNAIFYNKQNWKIIINIYKNSIEIQDTWIWIPKNDISKIFNRFYRNPNSWKFNKNWSWLWLSIVKKICTMFWRKLSVKSELWEWSIFTIKF